MKKSKIEISANILDRVAGSKVLSEQEKLNLLKYVGYLTYNEQQTLCEMI